MTRRLDSLRTFAALFSSAPARERLTVDTSGNCSGPRMRPTISSSRWKSMSRSRRCPMIRCTTNSIFGTQPGLVLADAGYCNERDLSEPEARGIDGYVATGRGGKRSAGRDAVRHPATHRMVEKPAVPAGRERYAQRKRLSGAPNGRIREVLGFRRFGVRGPAKARGNGTRCVRRSISGGCNRFRQCEGARPPAGWGRNHPHRGTRRPFRTLPRTLPAVAHFRRPDPRVRPRIGSGRLVRSRS